MIHNASTTDSVRATETSAARAENPDPHRRKGSLAGRAEARMEGHGGDAETCRGEKTVGGNPRREVDQAVHEQPDHRGECAHSQADAERVVPLRALALPAPGRAGGPTEEMGADEVPPDPPGQYEQDHPADHAQLQPELQEVVVGVSVIHVAGIECGRLIA